MPYRRPTVESTPDESLTPRFTTSPSPSFSSDQQARLERARKDRYRRKIASFLKDGYKDNQGNIRPEFHHQLPWPYSDRGKPTGSATKEGEGDTWVDRMMEMRLRSFVAARTPTTIAIVRNAPSNLPQTQQNHPPPPDATQSHQAAQQAQVQAHSSPHLPHLSTPYLSTAGDTMLVLVQCDTGTGTEIEHGGVRFGCYRTAEEREFYRPEIENRNGEAAMGWHLRRKYQDLGLQWNDERLDVRNFARFG